MPNAKKETPLSVEEKVITDRIKATIKNYTKDRTTITIEEDGEVVGFANLYEHEDDITVSNMMGYSPLVIIERLGKNVIVTRNAVDVILINSGYEVLPLKHEDDKRHFHKLTVVKED